MIKQEAYQAMLEGKKVTHDSFSDKEYLKMVESVILDEKNYIFELGWEIRNNSEWENGWSIFRNKEMI